MPIFDGEKPLPLGEGWTPAIHAGGIGAALGPPRLFVKDESLNPTNSFKARGLAAAVTRASLLGATTLSVPSAGNAANAMAAYAAAAGITAKVFMPKDVKTPFIRECELYGADVTLVEGLITDAGRIAAETGKALGDFLVLRAVRESGGTALAVSDADMVRDMRKLGSMEGISAAPEGDAALSALQVLLTQGTIRPTDTVVLFNTGGALKYLDVLA